MSFRLRKGMGFRCFPELSTLAFGSILENSIPFACAGSGVHDSRTPA
jgi:hypothetical protein